MLQIIQKISEKRCQSRSTIDYRLSTFHAFTLVELIIAIGIFAVFMSTAIAAYLQLSVALKRENIDRKLYGEIESVITDIQRQAKFYDIDYPTNGTSLNWPSKSLDLVSHDKQSKIHYGLIPPKLESIGILKETCVPTPTGLTCVPDGVNGFASGNLLPLTSNELKVKDLNFYIHPINGSQISSELTPQDQSVYQPKVTIIIHGEINNPYRPEPREFTVQTSISLRHYQ